MTAVSRIVQDVLRKLRPPRAWFKAGDAGVFVDGEIRIVAALDPAAAAWSWFGAWLSSSVSAKSMHVRERAALAFWLALPVPEGRQYWGSTKGMPSLRKMERACVSWTTACSCHDRLIAWIELAREIAVDFDRDFIKGIESAIRREVQGV